MLYFAITVPPVEAAAGFNVASWYFDFHFDFVSLLRKFIILLSEGMLMHGGKRCVWWRRS